MADEQPVTEVDEPTGPPRWVKVTGAVVGVLVLLFVVLHLVSRGGEHGPGRHNVGHVPTSTIVEQGPPQ